MERKIEYSENSNGSHNQKTVTTTNPSDGFVSQNQINPGMHNYGEYKMGWSKNTRYSTDNPKATIPFLIIMVGIFQVIAVVLIYVGIKNNTFENPSMLVAGIMLVAFLITFTIAEIKEIKRIKERFRNKQ